MKTISPEFLQNNPLFDGLSPSEMQSIIQLLQIKQFEKDETLYEEEDSSSDLYILADGQVEELVWDKAKYFQLFIDHFSRGDVFGENSFLENTPRQSSVEARSQVVVYTLSKEKIDRLEDSQPELYLKILNNVVQMNSTYLQNIKSATAAPITGQEIKASNKLDLDNKDSALYSLRSTVSQSSWILFAIAIMFLSFLIAWTILGKIPITVSGRGLIVSEKGLATLNANFTGKIDSILVNPGDLVKKGDLLVQGEEKHHQVFSLSDGLVLETLSDVGDAVQETTPVIWMENYLNGGQKGLLEIFGYFPIETGKRLQIDSPVEITVPSVNMNKYGTLKGRVKDIYLFSVSKENIYNEIQNKALVSFLSEQAPAVIKVIIEPLYDEAPNDYAWSSGLDPDLSLTSGTLVKLEAVVEEIRPIYYLLPINDFKSNPKNGVDGN